MAQYSPDHPPQYSRTVTKPDGTVLRIPQQLIPDPMGVTAGKLVDDPASPPYPEGTPSAKAPPAQTPAQATLTASRAGVATAQDEQRLANQAAGLGYYTNAEVTKLDASQSAAAANQLRAGASVENATTNAQKAQDAAYYNSLKNQMAARKITDTEAAAQWNEYVAQQKLNQGGAKVDETTRHDKATEDQTAAYQQGLLNDAQNTNATAERGQTLNFISANKLMPSGALTQNGDTWTANAIPNSQWADLANSIAQGVHAAHMASIPPPQFAAPAMPGPAVSLPAASAIPPGYGTGPGQVMPQVAPDPSSQIVNYPAAVAA